MKEFIKYLREKGINYKEEKGELIYHVVYYCIWKKYKGKYVKFNWKEKELYAFKKKNEDVIILEKKGNKLEWFITIENKDFSILEEALI